MTSVLMASTNQKVFSKSKSDKKYEKTYISEPHKPFMKVRNHLGLEDVHYSLVYEGFPEEFKKIAERDLKETEVGKRHGLQKLKEYMKSHHLPILKDDLLIAVLRACKYNMKRSEAKVKNFLHSRSEIIKALSTVEMENIENIIDDMAFGMLPYRDRHGRVIFYTRPYAANLDRYDINEVGLLFAVGGLFVLSFPVTTVAGFAYFGECKSNSLTIFYSIFKAFKKNMLHLFSYPIRVSRVEILNENSMCRCFHKLLSTVVSKKIMDRVSLHGSDFEYFYELYHPDILPEEFGGNMGTISNDAYRQKFLDFIKDLKKEKY